MIRSGESRKRLDLIVFSLVGLYCLAGCTRQNYKAEADKHVYQIIDHKWQDEFGTKANYRISDVTPSPNDIQIGRTIPSGSVLSLAQAVAIGTETQYFGGFSGGYDADWNDEVVGLEGNLGFNRLLATGTFISTQISTAWLDVLSGNMEGGIASVLTATVTQPLLRGADHKVVTENLTQAERDVLYQIRLFNRFRKTFVVSIITQYYQVLELYDLTRIYVSALKN